MLNTQIQQAQYRDGTFTDTNQLASALLMKPDVLDAIIYIMGRDKTSNVLQMLTQGTGRSDISKNVRTIGSDETMWAVQGSMLRSIPIVGPPSQTVRCGQNFSNFILPLAEKYFVLGDVCLFPDQTQCRVMAEPYQSGSQWCYTFQIVTSDANAFIMPGALTIGKEIGMAYTSFEEGSEGGGMKEATPMMFKNQMTIQRMSGGMTGSAKNTVVHFKFRAGGDSRKDIWAYVKQYELFKQWLESQEIHLWLGKYNRLPDGTIPMSGANGRPVKIGSGLEEQISGINQIVTSTLTEESLKHMLFDTMCQGKECANDKRVVVTGRGGMWAFDNAMKKAYGAYSNFAEPSFFVEKKTGNKLAFGSQFITYRGLMGTEFTLVHNPLFDRKEIFTDFDPVTGFTKKSFEMFFLDLSDYDGIPNLEMITRGAGGENRRCLQWFTGGSTSPDFTPTSKSDINLSEAKKRFSMASNGFDGFQCYILSETGIKIANPFSCGKITIVR